MDQLMHFTHEHLLRLIHWQPNHHYASSSYQHSSSSDNEEQVFGYYFLDEDHHDVKCNMCKERIYSFHLSYYNCKDCGYSLHKFCAEMPKTIQNHPLHPNHNLTLSEGFQGPHNNPDYFKFTEWTCCVCNLKRRNLFNYYCSICKFSIDIICATMLQQKMDHLSHSHQLQRMSKNIVSCCNACGHEHKGTFYHCTTCYWFLIYQDCALMPKKIFIQLRTTFTFTHSHPLALAYSFPDIDQKAKFYPKCRVCDNGFHPYFWLYKCDKCRYYAHIGCASSNYFNLMRRGRGRTYKNFKDHDHPDLLHCPFPDEGNNLIKHHFFNQKDVTLAKYNGKMLNHFSHHHPLILIDTKTSLINKSVFLHNPMERIKLLCDGCVKPITEMPFYKCSEDVQHCGFILHEWCARLPSKLQDYDTSCRHDFVLLTNVPKFFGVYTCTSCKFPSNGFAYGCITCGKYVDINCAFLHKEITHEAHTDHLLSLKRFSYDVICNACNCHLYGMPLAYHCPSCDFYLDIQCALLLPRMIRHKYDTHPLTLRYNPVKNHPGDYFCEICEDEFNPEFWFYHCDSCVYSMHSNCAPLILKCEQIVNAKYNNVGAFRFLNVKFGGTLELKGHPHRLSFIQGVKSHGRCKKCDKELQHDMVFKCFECEYALHYDCASSFDSSFHDESDIITL